MDGFENKNEFNSAVDEAAQNLSQAADEAVSVISGEAPKATSYEEVYGTVEQATGAEDDQQTFEPYSGVQVTYDASGEDNKANGLQIASLVLGILSIVLACCTSYIGSIFGIVGLILAILGNKENKNGIGTAGFVCSIVGIVLGIIMTIVGVLALASLGTISELL